MPPSSEVVLALTGGGAAVASSFITAWYGRNKRPQEIDSIIAQGSETAVETLMKTLAAETARADRAETAVRERDARIEALEAKIDVLQSALDSLREELHTIKDSYRP